MTKPKSKPKPKPASNRPLTTHTTKRWAVLVQYEKDGKPNGEAFLAGCYFLPSRKGSDDRDPKSPILTYGTREGARDTASRIRLPKVPTSSFGVRAKPVRVVVSVTEVQS